MKRDIASLRLCWLAVVALAPVWAAACSGETSSPGGSAGASGNSGNNGGSASGGNNASGGRSGGGGAPAAGSGGKSDTGGASGVLCGGETCTANQVCCGPSECGHCIGKLTKPACPTTCPSGGDAGAGGAPDCSQLLADVRETQAAAQACNPASAKPTLECAGTVEGLCCPILVESASTTTPANAAYLQALKSYKASCAQLCPAIACLQPKPGNCQPSSNAAGKCSP